MQVNHNNLDDLIKQVQDSKPQNVEISGDVLATLTEAQDEQRAVHRVSLSTESIYDNLEKEYNFSYAYGGTKPHLDDFCNALKKALNTVIKHKETANIDIKIQKGVEQDKPEGKKLSIKAILAIGQKKEQFLG